MRSALIKGTLLVTSTLTVMSGATISPSLPAILFALLRQPVIRVARAAEEHQRHLGVES